MVAAPGHGAPPPEGTGIVQDLYLILIPPPHSTVLESVSDTWHGVSNLLHGLQPPSIEADQVFEAVMNIKNNPVEAAEASPRPLILCDLLAVLVVRRDLTKLLSGLQKDLGYTSHTTLETATEQRTTTLGWSR